MFNKNKNKNVSISLTCEMAHVFPAGRHTIEHQCAGGSNLVSCPPIPPPAGVPDAQ